MRQSDVIFLIGEGQKFGEDGVVREELLGLS